MATQIVKYINLLNTVAPTRAATSYAFVTNYHLSRWVAAAYGGTVAVYFEAVFKVNATTRTGTIALAKADGTIVAGSVITSTSTVAVRVRSGNISADGNFTTNTNFGVQFKCSTSGTVTLYAARLVIIQSSTITATETQIDLGSQYLSDPGLPDYPTFVDATESFNFTYDSSKYDGTVAIYFEANLAATGTLYAALYDQSNNQVASSEISGNSTLTRVRSAAITLVNGTTYKVRMAASSGISGWSALGFRVIIQQTGTPTKTETYIPIRVSVHTNASTAGANLFGNFLYTASEWVVSSFNAYHEVFLKCSATNKIARADLNDGTTDLDTESSSSLTFQLLRSAAITLVDGKTYDTQLRIAATTATATLNGSHIIIQAVISASITLTVADSSQGQSVDSSALTQQHNLAIAGATQAQTVGAVVLIQVITLAIQDLGQAQTTESPALVQKTFLTVENVAQGQSIEAPAMTQKHNLTCQDENQGQAIESPVLTQKHILTSQNLTQGESLDGALSCLQKVTLTPADLFQGQTADGFALTQKHILISQNLAQPQGVDVPTLTHLYVLAAAAMAQGQSFETVALTQKHNLTVQDALQLQATDNLILQILEALAVQNIVQSQVTDSPTLIQRQNLLVSDLSQGQAADIVGVTTTYNLTSQGLTQIQLLEIAPVSQHHILTVQNSGQTQVLDAFLLTQKHNLTAQNLGQVHGVDPTILSLVYQLQAADLTQTQLSDSPGLGQEIFVTGQDCQVAQILDSVTIEKEINLILADLAQVQILAGISIWAYNPDALYDMDAETRHSAIFGENRLMPITENRLYLQPPAPTSSPILAETRHSSVNGRKS